MTFTAQPQFQDACIAALRASEFFMTLVPGGVHDALPENPAYPFAVLDLSTESPNRTMGQGGHDIDVILYVYTQDGSKTRGGTGHAGYAEAGVIAEAACAVLVNADEPLVVEGHDVVDVDIGDISFVREDDGYTRRCEIELTCTLEDQE